MRKERLRQVGDKGNIELLRTYAEKKIVENRVFAYFSTALGWDDDQIDRWVNPHLNVDRGDVEGLIFGVKPSAMFLNREFSDLLKDIAWSCGLLYVDQNQSARDCAIFDENALKIVLRESGENDFNLRRCVTEKGSYCDYTSYWQSYLNGIMLGYPELASRRYSHYSRKEVSGNMQEKVNPDYPQNRWMEFGYYPERSYRRLETELVHYIESFGLNPEVIFVSDPGRERLKKEMKVWLESRWERGH